MGNARIARRAGLSELNQTKPLIPRASSRATYSPVRPAFIAPAPRMRPPMRPRRRAVLSPLVQRCTTGPTRPPRAPFPAGMTSGTPRLAPARSSCLDQHPGRGHTDVMSTGGGRPLMTNTQPTLAVDPGAIAAPHASTGGLVKSVVELDRVVIRLAGDSGDGMQLTGNRFTSETASFGNDLSTLPNFPAEIRAPTGTLPGVSSFQLHFAAHDIMTPGDAPDVLVAMNPA